MPNLIDASVRPYFTVFVNFFCSQFCVDWYWHRPTWTPWRDPRTWHERWFHFW
jgi:hypothetical protein